MMVLFVSQCQKKAITKTRRVLDAFANRIGDNTWQTVMTQEGLLATKKLLRRTASKNTAVSCHWIRSRSRSELIWIVGSRDKFNEQGIVPVNSTKKNLLNTDIENDWKFLPLIKSLAALSALFHDWGKASQLFQDKLSPTSQYKFKGDPVRHEWISTLLLSSLVRVGKAQSDNEWLSYLCKGEFNEKHFNANTLSKLEHPLKNLPNAAKLVIWLIVSHHRLPLDSNKESDWRGQKSDSIEVMLKRISKNWGYENNYDPKEYKERINDCYKFPEGLLTQSKRWLKQVKKWSSRLQDCLPLVDMCIDNGSYRLILHHARLCLMLGDHFYSSQERDKKWPDTIALYANTDRKNNQFKQKLDEHLVGVSSSALKTAHLLPAFETEPPRVEDVQTLKKKSPKYPIDYSWQDKAVEKIINWKEKQTDKNQGFFAVNMASTGCGKTYANAKVMRALSKDSKSLRYILALGLRTLTLQTGDEYRDRIGLDNSELAVLIGSRSIMELHQQAQLDRAENSAENTGSLSQEALLDEEIDYDCDIPEGGLSTVLTCERDRQFLYAPVLSCTIDHIMSATETKRGGHYILPSLRLMSSDLVIDEIDDFTGHDLTAIGRLIHLVGMLGRKVMISSATIPPALAEGYFKAYRDGWLIYCKTRDANPQIGCAWIDEFSTQVSTSTDTDLPSAIHSYRDTHKKFIEKRIIELEKSLIKRKADIVSCQSILENYTTNHNDEEVIKNKKLAYFQLITNSALIKHQSHFCLDQKTNANVSFGVIRMANITPCIELTKYLLEFNWPKETEVRIMPYHSQQVLLMRHQQETHLDQVLKRKEEIGQQPEAFSNNIIRQHLDDIKYNIPNIKNILFILVATPVEEVGRDHDFDWAVIEPSSYRSIIQLAGRVRRHRNSEVTQTNISLMQYN